MNKTVMISDIHFGARNDNEVIAEYQEEFFHHLFDYMNVNDIKNLLVLGDVFDRRKFVNFRTMRLVNQCFIDPIVENNINTKIIIGNHDTYYKNTSELNSLQEIFYWHGIEIIDKIKQYDNDLYVPWLNTTELRDEFYDQMKSKHHRYVFGHFEIQGFSMGKFENVDGISSSTFQNCDCVFSGHFHIPQQIGNIRYIGSPFWMNWGDYGSDRGFYVLQNNDVEFMKNPKQPFVKIFYGDDLPDIQNKFVKVIVNQIDTTSYLFEQYMTNIYSQKPYNVKIDYLINEEYTPNTTYKEISSKSTMDVIYEYIDEMKIDNEREIKQIMYDLYTTIGESS